MDPVLFGWKIEAIEHKATQACNALWKHEQAKNDIDRLENKVTDLIAAIQTQQETIIRLETLLNETQQRLTEVEQRIQT